ncbi:UNVERIFIED_CONTAM: hypothetical protein DES50_102737 [Williamsia faeni]
MHPTVRAFTSLAATLATVGAVTFGGIAAPDTDRSLPLVSPEVRPAAVITGEIPLTVISNQFLYCSIICPYFLQFATTVPIAAVQSPGVFVSAYGTTGSVPTSFGVAAQSVTHPAYAAMTGIIVNDLIKVLPRAQNALAVAVVEAMKTAGGQDLDTGRTRILDALNAPITPNPPSTAITTTDSQVAAVEGINAGSAVVFQAPEWLLLGATETAEAAATELATTGDIDSARAVGEAHASYWVNLSQSVLPGASG